MKKPLMLLLGFIAWHSVLAQNDATITSPITTGISLPQLITTNINRSNLQFQIDLSEGYERPNFSVNFEKFISDESKQLKIASSAHLNHVLSFQGNDDMDFYSVNSASLQLGANLKLFNKSSYFIEFGTDNRIGKLGSIADFSHVDYSNTLDVAIGKGRIDFVNDGAAVLVITEKLTEYGLLNRELTNTEYELLLQKIINLKNRRKFVNRSYPLTEVEEIQDLLRSIGVISKDSDINAIIDDAYKFEPMIDRTTGSQFRIGLRGSHFRSNLFDQFISKGARIVMSYMIHSAINSKWQYNKGINGYAVVIDSGFDDPTFYDSKLRKVGFGIQNDLHYLLDNRFRVSLLSTVGYDFVNKLNTFDPFGNPFFDNDGIYINTRSEVEFQISRTMSTVFGINLNISPENTFTGLSLGFRF